ncbi:hypothetical protein BKA62DRAFT_771370 [Auriculariales sp. MPI-PUGE-AT-0066]|nr:hypothetical protein BKA62DRAFT_771370 [Auriculariales sp. MPI-PUGE-AT-0066]
MLGKLVHISVDVLILSALLAGIRRSTGITPSSSQIPNKDVRKWFQNYLEFGAQPISAVLSRYAPLGG